jgi:hypothetical protein
LAVGRLHRRFLGDAELRRRGDLRRILTANTFVLPQRKSIAIALGSNMSESAPRKGADLLEEDGRESPVRRNMLLDLREKYDRPELIARRFVPEAPQARESGYAGSTFAEQTFCVHCLFKERST